MSESHDGRGASPALLLLVPAAFILGTKAARQAEMHRAAFGGWGPGARAEGAEPGPGPEGGYPRWGGRRGFGRGFGGFGRGFGAWAANADPDTFQLPPMIERVLEAWHTRAHKPAGSSDETSAEA